MGRPGIDRKAIIATIESIAASGEEPNTMNVRRELGAGSYTTIIDVITQWKADRKAPKGAPAVVAPLPEKASALLSDMESKVLELLRPMAAEFWSMAASEAEAKLVPERQALDEVRQALDAEKKEDRAVIAALEEDVTGLEERVKEADRERNAAVAQLMAAGEAKGRLEALLETAREERNALSQRLAEFEKGTTTAKKK
jgi:hypothetical protein